MLRPRRQSAAKPVEAAGPLAGLCAGFLLIGSAAFAAGDVPAKPASGPAAQDQELDGLLLRIEQQISDGHTVAPANDNALDTWPRVVQGALPPSPQARRALADFVTRVRKRAADERAAGSNDVAVDLTLFKDLATALLAGADAATALPAQTGATQPVAEDVPLPAAAPTAPLADQGKAAVSDTSARSTRHSRVKNSLT